MEIMWQYSAVSFEMLQIGSCLRLNLKKVSDDNAKPLQTSFILQLLKKLYKFKKLHGERLLQVNLRASTFNPLH